MNRTNDVNDEKIDALKEALEHLAQAEELMRGVGDSHLDAYGSDHINANETTVGDGIAQEVITAICELHAEVAICPDCGCEVEFTKERSGYGFDAKFVCESRCGFEQAAHLEVIS